MQRFLYKAKNFKGEVVTGTVKAKNQVEAEKVLVRHSLVATDIVAEHQQGLSDLFNFKIPTKDRAVFSRQLATMLSAGLALTKAISILAQQAKNARQKKIFLDVFKDLEEGYSFSAAIVKHPEAFDRVYVSVVNSGESTGKLDVVLNELAEELENDSDFIGKIKGALYYPAFIFVALIFAAIFMLSYVIPKLKDLFDQANQTLPLMTRVLLAMSAFMQGWWWAVLLVIIGGAIAVKYWLETDMGSRFFHTAQISIPGVKAIYSGLYMYRFTRILSMLVSSGVPLLDSLRIAGAVIDNIIYEESIMKIASQVEKGIPLSSELIKNQAFPPLVGQMVAVGEETGELDKVLGKLADYYKQGTTEITRAVTALIEPMVLVAVGLGVAFIVFAIYVPIYQMNQFVK